MPDLTTGITFVIIAQISPAGQILGGNIVKVKFNTIQQRLRGLEKYSV